VPETHAFAIGSHQFSLVRPTPADPFLTCQANA